MKEKILYIANNWLARFLSLKNSVQVAVILFAASFLWVTSGLIFDSNGAVPSSENVNAALKVKTKTLNAENVNAEIVIKGKTKSAKSVTIKAETSGTITSIVANEGDRIKEGDVLLKLAEDDRPAKIRQAQALVEQRNLEYTAARNLSKKGFNSQVRLAEATALLNSARAELKAVELDFARAEIKAPFDGYFERKLVEIGDFVGIGTPVASFVDLDPIIIEAEISENNISHIEVGSKGFAQLINGEKIEGIITYAAKVSNDITRTYTIKLEAPNPDGKIVEGMTAEVRLSLMPVKAYKISPAILSLNEKGEVGIKTIEQQNTVGFYPISIVKHDNDGMWVSGLPDKIRLIISGSDFVKEGAKVLAVEDKS